jgi:type IV pilus assembly protein PilA
MLARLRKRNDENDEGFTLIELLVVIIIIGILAAIAIPVFLSQKTKGYEASMKSDLRTVAQEVEAQNVDTQSYAAIKFAGTAAIPATAVAGATITGSSQNVGDSKTVNLSNGNTITWVGNAATGAAVDSFCLSATHAGANTWYYSSKAGGISKTACTI